MRTSPPGHITTLYTIFCSSRRDKQAVASTRHPRAQHLKTPKPFAPCHCLRTRENFHQAFGMPGEFLRSDEQLRSAGCGGHVTDVIRNCLFPESESLRDLRPVFVILDSCRILRVAARELAQFAMQYPICLTVILTSGQCRCPVN